MRDNQLIMKKQQHMQKQTNEQLKCIHCKNIFLLWNYQSMLWKDTHLIMKEQLHGLQKYYLAMKQNTIVIYYNGVHHACLSTLSRKIQTKRETLF